MSFESAIRRVPVPFDPDAGRAVVSALGLSGPLADLIAGAAGCSPYLRDCLASEGGWLTTALDAPETALTALGAEADHLRRDKRRMALLVALADLGGVWDLDRVTRAITDFADRAVATALDAARAPLRARGKLPEDDGLFVLAMGKMGAFELNYSSDIDLICLFEPGDQSPAEAAEVRSHLIRAVRSMTRTLSDVGVGGYVFRTDLRLRPDASVTPVVVSTPAALGYYEGLGRTWERAAHIKARPAVGDLSAGARYLDTLRPFVWRRHLDFAAIEDTHDMLLKIRAHKGLSGPITLPGHDMKLGRGGIREIEFFAQTRQLISGGRDARLRVAGTVPALGALADAGWIASDVAATLTACYRRHREMEHRLQMLRDAQTHALPRSDAEFSRLAAFCGVERDRMERQLRDDLEAVHALTEPFFAPSVPSRTQTDETEFGAEITQGWPALPALRSARAAAVFDRVRPRVLSALSQADDPDQALAHFDSFLRGLPAGVQVFSLFEANPQLVELLTDIVSVSPALADYLGRNAQVLDAVLGGDFFAPWPGEAGLLDSLSTVMGRETDYERALDAARRWQKEWHFRIGVHLLRGLSDAEVAGAQYADLAAAVLQGVWPRVVQAFAGRHGDPPGRGAVIVGMGSLGAGRLHAQSDLDLLLIYDADGAETSDGPRPLAVRTYFARLTQALITALSAPMAQGRLYEVDMRLRPSGRNGPVATARAAFESYQRDEAWTWEHLALTRARMIAGDATLARDVEAFRAGLLRGPWESATIATDVDDMRRRLADAKPGRGGLSVKDGSGRLQDMELFAQTCALLAGSPERATGDQIAAGVAAGLIGAADGRVLSDAMAFLWKVRAIRQLVARGIQTAAEAGQGATGVLLRETGCLDVDGCATHVAQYAREAAAIIDRHLNEWGG